MVKNSGKDRQSKSIWNFANVIPTKSSLEKEIPWECASSKSMGGFFAFLFSILASLSKQDMRLLRTFEYLSIDGSG